MTPLTRREGQGGGSALFDKIWDAHVVQNVTDGPTQLYIDRLYCHEVTSPQAFEGLRQRGIQCFRPQQIFCMPDHNTPTHDQDQPIQDPVSARQVETLARNARDFHLTHFAMNSRDNGIIHVVGPEKGLSLPGMTIVCGDSHTSTHGAMGAVAFGIGTSEVEMVMASQCILQQKPKSMRITIDGQLQHGVTAKDVALYLMAQITTSGATGYFVEYAGEVVRNLSMEGRLTLCNLSIEMGARGGFIAPDDVTFQYLKGREYAPKGDDWDKAVAYWQTLKSDPDAVFDKELTFNAADIEPRITYGTNPGMGIGITEAIPQPSSLSPHPSALSPHPSSLSLHPSALSPHPSQRLSTTWVSSPASVCWVTLSTTSSLGPAPMVVSRTSVPLPPSSVAVTRLRALWPGLSPALGPSASKSMTRGLTLCSKLQASRFASQAVRPVWP